MHIEQSRIPAYENSGTARIKLDKYTEKWKGSKVLKTRENDAGTE